ncbi:2-phosphosulfolactate phosphatase [Actinoplanes couchii]|uniref:Probable 2-phosphosulfolactate phosphatase n=1 Tax=Actinoplanes couchii TaxID=403638 RepID=A0ABQ3XFB2_9ACTN|nr:2-phosphosulfolactate phosphatase [Actinoplanes couchii]MDR6321852.1 2-phosphosulfolactate phosphatase [Actinoplanes couchii]GID57192.1 hypothetical protein Aco03nite_055960 [Actinoplanes couchii]
MTVSPFAQSSSRIRFDWGPPGASVIGPGATIVAVVDVLSFTTSLTVAADRGIEVFPYRWRDERATAFAATHRATLAVGRSQACPDNPISLSPATIRTANGVERLVLPSPNGSTVARILAEQGATVIGVSLRNARAAAAWTARQLAEAGEHTEDDNPESKNPEPGSPGPGDADSKSVGTRSTDSGSPSAGNTGGRSTRGGGTNGGEPTVAVIAAGERWAGDGSLRPAVEDLWGAGAFIAGLADEGVLGLSPEALAAAAAYHQASADIRAALRDCAGGRELITGGYPQDVEVAAELNAGTVVPVLDGERFRPIPTRP